MISGPFYDSRGRLILRGDLLRSFHFRDSRRRVYYLHHVVEWNERREVLELVPYCRGPRHEGGYCTLTPNLAAQSTIVQGSGYVHERPRRNPAESSADAIATSE